MKSSSFHPWSKPIFTGTVIVLAHAAMFYALLLNPVHFQRLVAKESLVMLLPSQSPNIHEPSKPIPTTSPSNKAPQPMLEPVLTALPIPNQDLANSIALNASPADPSPAPPVVSQDTIAQPLTRQAKNEAKLPQQVNHVEYLQAPQADYPPMARRLGEEGRVVMQVLVNENGRAERVDILQSSGFARLDESARLALMRALFKPHIEDGRKIAVLATASISFSLRT